MLRNKIKGVVLVSLIGVVTLSSCSKVKRDPGLEYAPQMYRPIAYNPDQKNEAFADGKTAQKPVEGTIPQGFEVFHYPNTPEGYEAAGAELHSPLAKNEANFEEGKKLFLNMCSQCHGKTGMADGAVVAKAGFPAPPHYNSDALKNLPEGKMFFTITYGKGAMGSHASQLSKEERWKIIQYIQYLQKQ
ncbi:c-type cytochrome [Solitalea koreensis]|uniref:Quinol:cytochrome c oxidoreductase monoheme cytochrome subunit n=1 Tax=Solitalea koreensis TaxID=543615 RepID=A0A521AWB7_9SPHI|nr:cytochrome c [Solitalea koreensis]SMO39095.1 quinol:cytochrome c oxidoreductase monoheme cytochrome subunit [Solitalea koreensis]